MLQDGKTKLVHWIAFTEIDILLQCILKWHLNVIK